MKDSNKTWSSSSLASAFAHRLFYWAIRVGGRWVAYFMLHFVVGFYTCLPWVRERSQPYRLRRFGPRAFPRELVDCHRLQMEFGKMLVDRAVMGILGEFTMKASEGDRKVLSDIASCGRGLILVTGHAGCWQLGMSVLDHIDAPKAVVMYRGESDVDRHYFEHGESGPPFSIIDPCSPLGGTLEMMDVLKKGECCASWVTVVSAAIIMWWRLNFWAESSRCRSAPTSSLRLRGLRWRLLFRTAQGLGLDEFGFQG